MPLFSAGKAGRQQRLDKLLFVSGQNSPTLFSAIRDGLTYQKISDTGSVVIDSVAISADGGFGVTTIPGLSLVESYRINAGVFVETGFFSGDFQTQTSQPRRAVFSPSGNYIAVVGENISGTGPVYVAKRQGVGSQTTYKQSLPVPDQPLGDGFWCAWSPDETYLTVVGQFSGIRVYKRIADSFSLVSSAAYGVDASGASCCWDSTGTFLIVGIEVPSGSISPIIAFKRTGDTFSIIGTFGAASEGALSVTFSADGAFLAAGLKTAPFFQWFSRSGDTFTALPNPSNLPTGQSRGLAWNDDGSHLAVPFDTTTKGLLIYQRAGNTLTPLTTYPRPSGAGTGAAFFPGAVPGSV